MTNEPGMSPFAFNVLAVVGFIVLVPLSVAALGSFAVLSAEPVESWPQAQTAVSGDVIMNKTGLPGQGTNDLFCDGQFRRGLNGPALPGYAWPLAAHCPTNHGMTMNADGERWGWMLDCDYSITGPPNANFSNRDNCGNDDFGWIISMEPFEDELEDRAISTVTLRLADDFQNYAATIHACDDENLFGTISGDVKAWVVEGSYRYETTPSQNWSVPIYEDTFTTSNAYQVETAWNGTPMTYGCVGGFTLTIPVNGFDSLSIYERVNGSWNDVHIVIEVDNLFAVEHQMSLAGSDFMVPFYPDTIPTNRHLLRVEVSAGDASSVNFGVELGTLALSGVMLVAAIASTEAWNPFKQAMRRIGQ